MDAKKRSKPRKQRKLMQIFSASIKIFSRITDFQMKGMENCTNQLVYGGSVGCPSAPAVRLPKSYSVNSFTTCDVDEFGQLLRAACKEEAMQTALQTSMLPRSYSVCVGKIGRIDEEEPCTFEEDGPKAKLFPRSRSHVVKRI